MQEKHKLPLNLKFQLFWNLYGWIAMILMAITLSLFGHFYMKYDPNWEELVDNKNCEETVSTSLYYKYIEHDDETNQFWWEVKYTYELPDNPYAKTGYSYLPSRYSKKANLPHYFDQKATIFYHKINPNISKMHQNGILTDNPNPKTRQYAIILCFFAVPFLFVAVYKWIENLKFLELGILTKGKMTWTQRPEHGETNGVYHIHFAYTLENGETQKGNITVRNIKKLTDDTREYLLYLPHSTEKILGVDMMKANIKEWILANKKSVLKK